MPRQKITAELAEVATELPQLTAQQMHFVEGILAGKTASDAYRAAYDCSASAQSTIWVKASELRANEKVAVWLSAARKAGLGAAAVTYEGHVRELERIREIALESGNIGAAVQAEQIRGKAAGLHVEQHRDVTERFDAAQTVRELAEMTGIDAHVIAAQHGVTLPDESATKH